MMAGPSIRCSKASSARRNNGTSTQPVDRQYTLRRPYGTAGAPHAIDRFDLRTILRADRAHAQIDKLDVLLAAVVKAEGAIVDVVKFLPHEIQRLAVRQALRNLDMDLVTFAEIADVGDEMHRDRILWNSLGLDVGKSKPLRGLARRR